MPRKKIPEAIAAARGIPVSQVSNLEIIEATLLYGNDTKVIEDYYQSIVNASISTNSKPQNHP